MDTLKKSLGLRAALLSLLIFAAIVGLWQMVAGATGSDHAALQTSCGVDRLHYPDELERALLALWGGTIGRRFELPERPSRSLS